MGLASYALSVIPSLLFSVLKINSGKSQNCYAYVDSSNLKTLSSFFFLHHNTQLKLFSDLVGSDFLDKTFRFQLVYNILSIRYHLRFFLVSWADELSTSLSLSSLFPSSIWYEREVWDLLGVHFIGNVDLRRILTDYSFHGHPLRKDFPLTGFIELFYNYKVDTIVYREVSLIQEFRNFHTISPWGQLGS